MLSLVEEKSLLHTIQLRSCLYNSSGSQETFHNFTLKDFFLSLNFSISRELIRELFTRMKNFLQCFVTFFSVTHCCSFSLFPADVFLSVAHNFTEITTMRCSDSRTEGCPGTNSANSEAPGHGDAHLYIRSGGRHALFGEMVSWTQRVLSLYAQRGSRNESFPCGGSARCGEYEQKKNVNEDNDKLKLNSHVSH